MTNSVIQKIVVFVFFGIIVSGCALEDDPSVTSKKDIVKPTLTEITDVKTPTNDTTPDYTFSSDESGTITYGGSCSSSTSSVDIGNNMITLDPLSDGTYSDCTISVTDNNSNISDNLTMSSFEIDSTSPTIEEVNAVTNPTNDSTPSYTFSSDEAGTITYGGSCYSTNTSAVLGNNTIILESLSEGTYSNCKIRVTDHLSNTSDNLTITSFTIAISPIISELTAITKVTTDRTPDYIFSSDESGTITYGGSCSSTYTEAVSGNNTITLNSLNNGTYLDCTITVTDTLGNFSNTLDLTSFSVGEQIGGSIQGVELSLTTSVGILAGGGTQSCSDGIGTSASFYTPQGITTDGTNLYVADSNCRRIRKVVISSGEVTSIWQDNFYPHPIQMTTDGTNLYFTGGHAIHKLVISTGTVSRLVGYGSGGFADGTGSSAKFNNPSGITIDGVNLYVADYYNNRIRKIVISTGVVTTVAGTGSIGSANGTGTSASFYSPHGITTDGTNLYVADRANHLIRKIVISTGVVTTLAGTGSTGYSDGMGTSASFNMPIGITTDGTNLYVSDSSNHIIRKIIISTGLVRIVAGSATNDMSHNGTGTGAGFTYPNGITTDGKNLYVTTGNNWIRVIQ
jgi:hypothetical protein